MRQHTLRGPVSRSPGSSGSGVGMTAVGVGQGLGARDEAQGLRAEKSRVSPDADTSSTSVPTLGERGSSQPASARASGRLGAEDEGLSARESSTRRAAQLVLRAGPRPPSCTGDPRATDLQQLRLSPRSVANPRAPAGATSFDVVLVKSDGAHQVEHMTSTSRSGTPADSYTTPGDPRGQGGGDSSSWRPLTARHGESDDARSDSTASSTSGRGGQEGRAAGVPVRAGATRLAHAGATVAAAHPSRSLPGPASRPGSAAGGLRGAVGPAAPTVVGLASSGLTTTLRVAAADTPLPPHPSDTPLVCVTPLTVSNGTQPATNSHAPPSPPLSSVDVTTAAFGEHSCGVDLQQDSRDTGPPSPTSGDANTAHTAGVGVSPRTVVLPGRAQPGGPSSAASATSSAEAPGVWLRYAACSLPGRVDSGAAKRNQDSFQVTQRLGGLSNVHLFLVADGHGPLGTEASQFVVTQLPRRLATMLTAPDAPAILRNCVVQGATGSAIGTVDRAGRGAGEGGVDEELDLEAAATPAPPPEPLSEKDFFALAHALRVAINEVQDAMFAQTRVYDMSGTTLVAVLLCGQHVVVGNVGDSRCVLAYAKGRDRRRQRIERKTSGLSDISDRSDSSNETRGTNQLADDEDLGEPTASMQRLELRPRAASNLRNPLLRSSTMGGNPAALTPTSELASTRGVFTGMGQSSRAILRATAAGAGPAAVAEQAHPPPTGEANRALVLPSGEEGGGEQGSDEEGAPALFQAARAQTPSARTSTTSIASARSVHLAHSHSVPDAAATEHVPVRALAGTRHAHMLARSGSGQGSVGPASSLFSRMRIQGGRAVSPDSSHTPFMDGSATQNLASMLRSPHAAAQAAAAAAPLSVESTAAAAGQPDARGHSQVSGHSHSHEGGSRGVDSPPSASSGSGNQSGGAHSAPDPTSSPLDTSPSSRPAPSSASSASSSHSSASRRQQHQVSCMRLTEDHKLSAPKERERVLQSGGQVRQLVGRKSQRHVGPLRVWSPKCNNGRGPGLAMSRSVGDRMATEVGVTCNPTVTYHLLRPGVDRALVLASDGVWDHLSSRQVCSDGACRQPVASAASRVCDTASDAWDAYCAQNGSISCDDITCLVLHFWPDMWAEHATAMDAVDEEQ